MKDTPNSNDGTLNSNEGTLENKTEDIIYFQINNWIPNKDYPNTYPFNHWVTEPYSTLLNKEWVEENKICVLCYNLDLSLNFCISAPRQWVEEKCPKLLTDYTWFLKEAEEDEELPRGRDDVEFIEYSEENIGVYRGYEAEDDNGYYYYDIEKQD